MAKRKSNQKRKEEKKIEEVKSGIDFSSSIYVVAGILLFILAFYLLTLYITNKNKDDDEDNTPKEVEISSDKILVGSILSKSKDEYLVLCYDFNTEKDTYDSIFTTAKATGKKIYKVDLGNGLNSKYITNGESNKNPTKANEFLINGASLIKVNNNKVVEYIEGQDQITNYLN